MKKFTKYITGLLLGTMLIGNTVFAAPQYTVTDAPAVLYTNDATVILADADTKAQVILSADAIASGLPIQVTGVTSNGFFRISLNNATYYVAGAGLQAAPTAQVVAAPAQNNGKKYTCVIEAGDKDLYYNGQHKYRPMDRKDVTDRPLYIAVRDIVEQKIASGQKTFSVEYTTREAKACVVGDNLLIDIRKAYPQYNTTGSKVYYDYYATAYDGFSDNGDREVTIELEFSTENDVSMILTPEEGGMSDEEFNKWFEEHRVR